MTIEIRGLAKRYGPDTVVDDLTFTVEPGQVTGFLGPNGAGKSTTMKMILGLAAPTRGSVTVGGRRYRDLPVPLTEVGALLDAGAVHGGRKAGDHLLALAVSNGLPRRRVGEVLARTGLDGVAGRLRQVVANLVGNAAAHTPPGTPVRIGVGTAAGRAVLEVADEGPGMTAGQAERVFNRFYRADRSRTRSGGANAGLGLSIARSLARAHGGDVELETAVGAGACFRLALPLPPG